MFADANPAMAGVRGAAQRVEQERKRANPANPFLALEKLWADSVVQTSISGATCATPPIELGFFAIYGSPRHASLRRQPGLSSASSWTPRNCLRICRKSRRSLLGIDRGGFEVAVIRMLIMHG